MFNHLHIQTKSRRIYLLLLLTRVTEDVLSLMEQVEVNTQISVIKQLNEEDPVDVYLCEDATKVIKGNSAKVGWPTWPLYLAAWGPLFWPSWLRCRRSFLHRLPLDLKMPIKEVPRRSLEDAPPQDRNTKTEIWSCRLEGENSGGALPAWPPSSPSTCPPSP